MKARRHPEGDFPGVIDLLLSAGAPFDKQDYPVGQENIDAVLKHHLNLQGSPAWSSRRGL